MPDNPTAAGSGRSQAPVTGPPVVTEPARQDGPVQSHGHAGGGAELATPADDGDLGRILTVPNAVTALRLACIPVFVWLLFGAHDQGPAAIVLAGLGATDWVDGTVARRFGQVSTVGKILDPVADRILVATAVICIVVDGAVPIWFAVATVAREAVVSAAVLVLASLGAERIDVLWIGKAGTFAIMAAYPAFLLAHGTTAWQHDLSVAAWIVGITGLILAWSAAVSYLPVARRALARGRRSDAGTSAPEVHPGTVSGGPE